MKRILAGLVAVASVTGAASGAQAQSFNCRKAYFADETLICMSPELSRLDERLNRIFGRTRNFLSPSGRSALDREEERWVVARRRCGADHQCVVNFYRDRIAELSERLGPAPGEARRGDWDDNRGDDRDEPPSAAREGWRDGPPPERVAPEPPAASNERWRNAPPPERFTPAPPSAESRRERPVATSRARPNDSDRLSPREAAAPPRTRHSNSEDGVSRAEETETTTRPAPPPKASETRQTRETETETAVHPGASAAVTAPEPLHRQKAAAQPARPAPALPPEAATGSSVPAPHIEFADPASPLTPAR